MSRAILTILLVVLMNVLIGCGEIDSGKTAIISPRGQSVERTDEEAAEADVVEQVTASRNAYRQGLELLVGYYTRTGNNMKLRWAKAELASVDGLVQYNYIVEAMVAGPDLKASESISEANRLYWDAVDIENRAGGLIIVKDDNLLRSALEKYNELIIRYPSSNKIDDAAFKAAGIYEHFRDYSIAVLYYKRVYQWNPETTTPAIFRAAYILDKQLHRRAEALEIYQEAVESGSAYKQWYEYARKRITELTKSDEAVE